MIDGNLRKHTDSWIKPIGVSLRKWGVSADVLTGIGVVMAIVATVVIGLGYLSLGVLFVALTGIPDLLDGAVAKASGTTSNRGAFFDSVMDRITDALLFGGVAWYFTTQYNNAMPLLPYAVFASAVVVSYIRAKAEAFGYDARGGLVERAERFILLIFGLLFEPVLVAVLVVMLVANMITIGQRFTKVWKQATLADGMSTKQTTRRRRRVQTSAAAKRRQRREQRVR